MVPKSYFPKLTVWRPISRCSMYISGRLTVIFTVSLSALEVVALDYGDTVPITTAAKANEIQEAASWEEPSLFHQEIPDTTKPASRFRTVRSGTALETDDLAAIPPIEASELAQEHAERSFRTEQGASNYSETPGMGLASSRERDALLAKIQSEATNQPYNIKIGRLPLRVGASLGFEFSDNIRRSGLNKEADLIAIPRLDVTGSVKLGTRTSVSLGLGIGYVKYFSGTEEDRFLLSASLAPDSGISLNVKVGKFLISVYDKPSLPQFQADAVTQREQNQFNQFSNTAGVTVLWDVNSRTSMSFRYNHSDTISFSSDSNTTDASTESFLVSLSCKLSDSMGVGIEAGTQITKYKTDLLNDGITSNIGPFISYELSKHLRFQASVGYQSGTYGDSGSVEDRSSLGTYYASVSIANDLNSYVRHSLTLGRQSQGGSFSNFAVSNYAKYQINWDLIRGFNFGGTVSFEDIEESGGLFAEHFQNCSIGIYAGVQLSKHINLGLQYVFSKRYVVGGEGGGQADLLDYTENRVSLNLGYTF